MKYAIHLYPYTSFPDLAAIDTVVRRADVLGFDVVLLPDHIIFPSTYSATMGGDWWDPLILATHLVAQTTRIRFTTGVTVLPLHHPVHLAKKIATLDVISGGRIGLGVGIGWLADEFDMLGADFHARGARADEYIEVMRTLWTHEPSSFRGRYVEFEDASFLPKPVQDPHPPILIGGGLPHSVDRAVRLGDGWMPMAPSFAQLLLGLHELRAAANDIGRDLNGFEICWRLPVWRPTPEAIAHATMASGQEADVPFFDGDLAAAKDFVSELESAGVTLVRVELPHGSEAMLDAMDELAARMF